MSLKVKSLREIAFESKKLREESLDKWSSENDTKRLIYIDDIIALKDDFGTFKLFQDYLRYLKRKESNEAEDDSIDLVLTDKELVGKTNIKED